MAGGEDNNGPEPADGEQEKLERDLAKRLKAFWLKERDLELKTEEDKQAARQKQIEKDAKDDRAAILKAVKVSTPDLSKKLFETMEELAYADHEFAKREAATLMKLTEVRLKDVQEFFDLSAVQKEDLLDRVGFYRGVTIDHRLSNPVQVSFRDVLKRPGDADAPPAGRGKEAIAAARVFYRRPNFAGYFENFFTASEAVHQSQKNGVTNLKFSLAVSSGVGVKAGVGVGGAYNEQSQINEGGVGKKVYITSNFFLPRIELSFDARRPCASPDFVAACEEAVAIAKPDDRFHALKKVLDAFGQFAVTQTLIGGRLFATEIKDFKGVETGSDVTKRFAAEVKASLNTPTTTAEASISADRSNQVAQKTKTSDESQSMTFHAVGGEGGVVQNAAAWTESLFDYRRWSAVQRENLISSIDLLPKALAETCWEALKAYAQTRTKRDLLFADNAYFLFYGEYGERIGALAEETYFTIRNTGWNTLVTVSAAPPEEKGVVSLIEPKGLESQIWRMSPEGHLVTKLKREPGAYGRRDPVEFALTISGTPAAEGKPAAASVSLRQLGRAPHQTWEYSGSGELISTSFGKDHVLAADKADTLIVRHRDAVESANQYWDLIEVGRAEVEAAKPAAAASQPDSWFKLAVGDGRMVLSVLNGETRAEVGRDEVPPAVLLPDVGGAHQLWRLTAEGHMISRLAGGGGQKLLLTLAKEGDPLTLSPATANLHQRWQLTVEGYLAPLSGDSAKLAAGGEQAAPRPGEPVKMTPRERAPRQLWSRQDIGRSPVPATLVELAGEDPRETGKWVKMVDKRPLKVNGRIDGLRFRLRERGGIVAVGEGYALQLEILVRRGPDVFVLVTHPADNPGSDERDEISTAEAFADAQLLYLPREPIYELKLGFKPGSKCLAFMYNLTPGGPWIHAPGTDKPAWGRNLEDIKSTCVALREHGQGRSVLAIGVARPAQSEVLNLRVLVG